MARKKIKSEDWSYISDILGVLAQTVPPVLTTSAAVAQGISNAQAQHEARMRELELHQMKLQILQQNTAQLKAGDD